MDVDFSPKVSPLRKHEADHQTPMGGDSHQQEMPPVRQGSHMQQVQMMSSMNKGLPHHAAASDNFKKNNHGSAMTSLKSPTAAGATSVMEE